MLALFSFWFLFVRMHHFTIRNSKNETVARFAIETFRYRIMKQKQKTYQMKNRKKLDRATTKMCIFVISVQWVKLQSDGVHEKRKEKPNQTGKQSKGTEVETSPSNSSNTIQAKEAASSSANKFKFFKNKESLIKINYFSSICSFSCDVCQNKFIY